MTNRERTHAALAMEPTEGIPAGMLHVMDIPYLERRSGHAPGAYRADPDRVYCAFQRTVGTGMVDQYLAANPLSMGAHGYESDTARSATTGAETIVCDGIPIRDADDVARHLESVVFPALEAAIAATDPDDLTPLDAAVAEEQRVQQLLGPDILKIPYAPFYQFPVLRYGHYGYAPYLTAFVMYPELMERDFRLQADLALRHNRRCAAVIQREGWSPVLRLDHDMADSTGPLVDVRMLEARWFPHFDRAIQPLLDAGIRLLWHCDGNLMTMVPRLIACGIGGFQGFQYEDGMDYARLCAMTDRHGGPLMIWGGVSVTRTLPFGTPDDVRAELAWLVRHAPPVGFFLGASSSIAPGVPHPNLDALIDGLAYYRGE